MSILLLLSITFLMAICYGFYRSAQLERNRTRRLFLLLLQLLAAHFIAGVVVSIQQPDEAHYLVLFPLHLLYSPGCYILFRLCRNLSFSKIQLIHLLPFTIALLMYVILILMPSWRYLYGNKYIFIKYFLSAELYILYIVLISSYAYRYQKQWFNQDKPSKSILFLGMLGCLTLIFTFLCLYNAQASAYHYQLFCLQYLLIVVLTMCVLISSDFCPKTVPRPRSSPPIPDTQAVCEDTSLTPPKKYTFTSEQLTRYRRETQHFIAKQAYLAPDFTGEDLGRQVAIPRYHLSLFIDKEYQQSVNGFITMLRLHYAAEKLKQVKFEYTIDGLSAISGFRSRAAFYRNFVDMFGCSPHAYRTRYLSFHEQTPSS